LVTFEITEIIGSLWLSSTNFVSKTQSAVTIPYMVLLYTTIRLCHRD
jgi:hypothetical protein